jgi:hypothetical protein
MTFKQNFTDIRSVVIREPLVVRTVGTTGANSPTAWKYLTTGTVIKGSDLFLIDGVVLTNPSPNPVVVSKEGISAGTIGSTGADGYILNQNQNLNLKVKNLADVIIKSTVATASTGITLSYIAS